MPPALAPSALLPATLREDFPILATMARGKPLVYLDNAATSQKPRQVIDALSRYYEAENANIHRGVHYLSERATLLYDETREAARRFINAASSREVIFTRGTTEAINLVAQGFGSAVLRPGDRILVSTLEHHSNIVPWQLACARSGAELVEIPIHDDGSLDMEAFDRLLDARVKLVAVTWVSNALGTITPVAELVRRAHALQVPVLLDGAQAAPHIAVDVQAVGCDFFACSGHKMLGPTGVGLLYGTEQWLDRLPPYQGGGDMIETVTIAKSTWAPLPSKFEAGTPDIAAVVAFRAALDYLTRTGVAAIAAHEHELVALATERLAAIPGVRIIGTASPKAGVVSFTMDCAHPHDIGTILDSEGVAIRTGHHCAQPLMQRFAVPSTARASFYLYNTPDEVDALVRGVEKVRQLFA